MSEYRKKPVVVEAQSVCPRVFIPSYIDSDPDAHVCTCDEPGGHQKPKTHHCPTCDVHWALKSEQGAQAVAAHAASPDADGSGSAAEITRLRDESRALRAALVDAMLRWSGRDAFDQPASELAQILDQHPEPQPASEPTAVAETRPRVDWARVSEAVADRERERDEARAELGQLRDHCEANIASLTDQRNRVSDTADQLRALVDGITRTVRKWTVVPQDHAEINDWRKQAGLEAL